mgnify:CR=1 FL=1
MTSSRTVIGIASCLTVTRMVSCCFEPRNSGASFAPLELFINSILSIAEIGLLYRTQARCHKTVIKPPTSANICCVTAETILSLPIKPLICFGFSSVLGKCQTPRPAQDREPAAADPQGCAAHPRDQPLAMIAGVQTRNEGHLDRRGGSMNNR